MHSQSSESRRPTFIAHTGLGVVPPKSSRNPGRNGRLRPVSASGTDSPSETMSTFRMSSHMIWRNYSYIPTTSNPVMKVVLPWRYIVGVTFTTGLIRQNRLSGSSELTLDGPWVIRLWLKFPKTAKNFIFRLTIIPIRIIVNLGNLGISWTVTHCASSVRSSNKIDACSTLSEIPSNEEFYEWVSWELALEVL